MKNQSLHAALRSLTVAALILCTSAVFAQQVQPTADFDPATISDPLGKKFLTDAYQKSLLVKKPDDLNAIIEGCERALAERLVEKDQKYAHQLVSWAYNRQTKKGTPEDRLYRDFLVRRDWV